MSRIKPEDMTTLISASQAKTVADGAIAELEEMSVAHLINEAANCGQHSVVCARPVSGALKTKLEGQGYTLSEPSPIAKVGDEIIISWKDAE